MFESLFRPWRYRRALARFSRPAPLVVTKAGRHFSAPGAESVPFLRGGCPSSPSPSWRRFLVSVRVSGRCSEQVQLHLRWMISFLMESIWVLWKSTTKEKRIMVNKNVETKSLNSSVHPIIMDIWKQISRCSHSHPEPLFLHVGQELSGVWKPSHPFVCTFHSAPIPFACGSPEPIIRRTSHNFNYIFTVSKDRVPTLSWTPDSRTLSTIYFIFSTYQIHTPAYVVSWKTLQF